MILVIFKKIAETAVNDSSDLTNTIIVLSLSQYQHLRKQTKKYMTMISIDQDLLVLRELIMSGGDTLIVLEYLDRLLHKLSIVTLCVPSSDSSPKLLTEAKKSKKKVKELTEENLILKEKVSDLKINLEMMQIKQKKIEQQMKKLIHTQLREERKEQKKKIKKTAEAETQCDNPSPILLQAFLIIQKSRKENEEMKIHFQKLQQNKSKAKKEKETQTEGKDLPTRTQDGLDTLKENFWENPEESLILDSKVQKSASTPVGFEGVQSLQDNIVNWIWIKANQFIDAIRNQ